MNEQIRHKRLLELLDVKGILSTPEIIAHFDISPATARRDITKLSQQGKLSKMRNGVEKLSPSRHRIPPVLENISDEKQRIAMAAAKLCNDKESVILTCGSTMMALGAALCKQKLQIITNYLPLANYLIEHEHDNVVIMGGQYNKNQAITLSLSESGENAFAANIMFTSAKGLTTSGLYKTDMLIASSEQRILQRAEKLIVLVDSSKLGKTVGMLFTELKNIDVVITGKEADINIINSLREKGLNIILA
ncbi:HTH-type transcriptional regulator UlaR [Pasteurellaceae bacterium LIM206]|nr:HTH-type transcriptional regulator UlaR [Pasteurellaceae bacterium LIM206]